MHDKAILYTVLWFVVLAFTVVSPPHVNTAVFLVCTLISLYVVFSITIPIAEKMASFIQHDILRQLIEFIIASLLGVLGSGFILNIAALVAHTVGRPLTDLVFLLTNMVLWGAIYYCVKYSKINI